ncbi:MAG: ABC transporter substrate-binding protein [Halodesulfurarchaeum sp.]
MPEKTSRRKFLAAAGTSTIAALAGCGGGGDSGNTTTTGGGQDTTTGTDQTTTTEGETVLQMASTGPIQTLDPINAKGSGAGYDQYGRSLFEFENGTYPPVAALASDYSVSDDGKTYTIELKQGVQFHDFGGELTASDVVYSWERLAGSPNTRNADDIIGDTMQIAHEKEKSRNNPDEAELADYVAGSLQVEAVDEYTFRFTLAEPFKWTLYQIAGGAFAILPENAVGDIEREGIKTSGEFEYNEFFGTANGGPKYSGLGPFRVETWNKGSDLQLTAFEDYYGQGPELDGITYTIISSGNTRLQRFKARNLDILESIPTASFNPDSVTIERQKGRVIETGTYEFDDGQTVNYGQIPALSTEYIVFNCDRVPLAVRQAMALLLNQDRVARDAYKGVAKAAYHITPPAVYPTFEDNVPAQESYDRHAAEGYMSNTDFGANGYPWGYGETRIQEARQVMEDAGFGPNNQFNITATNISGNDAYANVFTTLQEKSRQAHISMDITEADFGTIIGKAINGTMDMFALGDGMEYPSASNFLRFLHAGSPGTAFTRWGTEGETGPTGETKNGLVYANTDYVQTAAQAWEDNYKPYRGGGERNQQKRFEAYQTIEEMNWASVQELPTVHPIDQRLWHQNVDVQMYSVMENQTFNTVTKSNMQ